MIQQSNLKVCILLALTFLSINLFAQDEDDSGKQPVRSPFETGMLIDNPTIVSPYKGGLELNIQHRMGTVKNGITDLFGIYGSANLRLALNYGITDRIAIGLGTSNYNKSQDLNWKVALIRQNRSGSVPVSLSYYGNVVLDTRAKQFFGPEERYRGIHRFSYFTEFILARKFNDILSLQVAPSLVYFNAIAPGMENVNLGISAGGRAKILSSSSIIFEYDQSLTKSTALTPKPNAAIGYEIGTATHCFQIFAATYDKIIPQQNLVFNANDAGKGEFVLGFNITVRF